MSACLYSAFGAFECMDVQQQQQQQQQQHGHHRQYSAQGVFVDTTQQSPGVSAPSFVPASDAFDAFDVAVRPTVQWVGFTG